MPTVYAGGSAVAILRPGGYAAGVANVSDDSHGCYAEGEIEVDRRTVRAFLARVRLVRPEVYVGDMATPLAELVETVEVSERLDDLVVSGSFTVAKAEASRNMPSWTGSRTRWRTLRRTARGRGCRRFPPPPCGRTLSGASG